MEVDRVAEVLPVSKTAGHSLHPLDPAVEGLGSRVRDVRSGGVDDALPVSLDHAGDGRALVLADRRYLQKPPIPARAAMHDRGSGGGIEIVHVVAISIHILFRT